LGLSLLKLQDSASRPRATSNSNINAYCRWRHLLGIPNLSRRRPFFLFLLMDNCHWNGEQCLCFHRELYSRFFPGGWRTHFLSLAELGRSAQIFGRSKGSVSNAVIVTVKNMKLRPPSPYIPVKWTPRFIFFVVSCTEVVAYGT